MLYRYVKARNIRRLATQLFVRNSYTGMFFRAMPFYVALIHLLIAYYHGQHSLLMVYVAVPCVLFFLVNTRWLLFFRSRRAVLQFFLVLYITMVDKLW